MNPAQSNDTGTEIKDTLVEVTQTSPPRGVRAETASGSIPWPEATIVQPELRFAEPLNRWQRFIASFSSPYDKATGLAQLGMGEFLALSEARGAFQFATESDLARGWWSSLTSPRFLAAPESKHLRDYLRPILSKGLLVEIGVRERASLQEGAFRQLGARHYVGIDRQAITEQGGGVRADALAYLARLPNSSVAAIAAFGVFNHPMALEHVLEGSAPGFRSAASAVSEVTRGHCEHEYARRLSQEIVRVLMPEGLLFGDGIFAEQIGVYFRRAGLIPDAEPFALVGPSIRFEFDIQQCFFLRTISQEIHRMKEA